jgi:hypothetical protein
VQIESIGIYNAAGESRLVSFHQGLNILTGWSGTGKSALLDIAEFCLGRRQATYPEGALTDVVAWFSITVEHAGTRVFVARPAPPRGSRSTQQAMIKVGVGGVEVTASELEVNADTDTIREQLTRLLGMPGHDVRISTPYRSPLETTIAQALFYCFQAENEITNKSVLFHRATELGEAEAIRDTLPYFLGAAELNTVALRRQLDEARRDLRRAESRLARRSSATERLDAEVVALVTQAQALGLLAAAQVDAESDPIVLLQEAAAVNVDDDIELGDAPEQYRVTRERQRELVERLLRAQEQAALVRRFSAQRQLFETEVDEQRARLQTINLLPEPASHARSAAQADSCPLCGSALPHDDVDAKALHASVEDLNQRLAQVADLEPRATAQLQAIEAEIDAVRADLREVGRELATLAASEVALQEARDVSRRRAYLQGMIAAYLETARAGDDDAALEREVTALRARVDELDALVDLDEQRQRVASMLQYVSRDMTRFAQALRLEHSEDSVRLDAERLTVIADTPTGPIELARMGSQANIVGYHLVAHLALHRWFVQQRRPVPRFVFFDQPTQPFYPDEVRTFADEEISDEDRTRVAELFVLLRDVAAELEELQIIVPDHANLPDDWFQQAVVENWRDGEALVPEDWL